MKEYDFKDGKGYIYGKSRKMRSELIFAEKLVSAKNNKKIGNHSVKRDNNNRIFSYNSTPIFIADDKNKKFWLSKQIQETRIIKRTIAQYKRIFTDIEYSS